MMDRRFPYVVTITLILLATALTVDAQPSKKAATIGILHPAAPESADRRCGAPAVPTSPAPSIRATKRQVSMRFIRWWPSTRSVG